MIHDREHRQAWLFVAGVAFAACCACGSAGKSSTGPDSAVSETEVAPSDAAELLDDAVDATRADATRPAPGFDGCPGGTARRLDGVCAPVSEPSTFEGRLCAFPAAEGRVLRVDASVQVEGDGSADSPFATLSAAVAAASNGTTIQLGPGTYAGGVLLPSGVAVVGTCAKEVEVVGPASGEAFAADAVTSVWIEGIRIRGAGTALRGFLSKDIRLRDVAIEDCGQGVHLSFSTAYVEGCEIRDLTASTPSTDQPDGVGLYVRDGSSVVLANSTVADNAGSGASIEQSELALLAGVQFQRNTGSHLVLGPGAHGVVEDVSFEDVRLTTSEGRATALLLSNTGALRVERSQFQGNPGADFFGTRLGPTTVLGCTMNDGGGLAVLLTEQPFELRDTDIRVAGEVALRIEESAGLVLGPGNRFSAPGDPQTGKGFAVAIIASKDIEFHDNEVEQVLSLGVLVDQSTGIRLHDNTIHDIGNSGVWIQRGSHASVEANTVRDTGRAGIGVSTNSQVAISGNTIEGVAAFGGDSFGVLVFEQAAARITGNLQPEPTGIMPSPEIAYGISNPSIPAVDAIGLPAGVAVELATNTTSSIAVGVAVQQLAAVTLVSVAPDNDFTDVPQEFTDALILQLPAALVIAPAAPIPLP